MEFLDNILDSAADKVQMFTGEKERRQLVDELKVKYNNFKDIVITKIDCLNVNIVDFNKRITNLNILRKGEVESNINELYLFLSKFGAVKTIGKYVSEKEKSQIVLPEQQFEKRENYIKDIDWSKNDVFFNTFFRSPIGMMRKTRKQTLSLQKSIKELKIESKEILNELEMRIFTVEIDQKVCDLYIDCVNFITNYINNIILPELELIEAFFQANKIKNKILVDGEIENLILKNDIQLLKNTIYNKHYLFVKNTFMFYIISCKIYHTPVLTHVLNSKSLEGDVKLLEKQRNLLIEQGKEVTKYLVIDR